MQDNGKVRSKKRQNKKTKSSNSHKSSNVNERVDDASVNQDDNNSLSANALQTGMYMLLSAYQFSCSVFKPPYKNA